MNFLSPDIDHYVHAHTRPPSAVLQALSRETHHKVLMPRMLSGHLQGEYLRMVSYMIQPRYVLEIGTFTGYATICLCAGLAPNGILHTIDINEELEEMAKRYFEQAGFDKQIQLHVGNALNIIPTLQTPAFDLIFIDADKQNYSNYYDLVIDRVRQGGFIIADNVLWSGKVVLPNPDKDTRALLAFNEKIQNDPRIENVLLPIRDGLMIIRKK
jgi:caffeoyl-CoA O-methyltransferase